MHLKRLSRMLFATGGALLLLTNQAAADTGHASSFSASTYTLGANANITTSFTFGAHEVDSVVIDFPPGFKFAHADGYGNELASNPNDGDQIGSGTMKASWVFLLCGVATMNMNVYWEENMIGAPMAAVAHWQIVSASVGTYDAWLIEENDATDDYKLVIEFDQTWTCSSSSQPTDAGMTLTIWGTSSSGGEVYRNPSSSGNYTVTTSYVEVGGTNHSGTACRNFPNGTSC